MTDHISQPARRSRLAAWAAGAVLLLATTAPALAVCPICNGSVRLDKNLAVCFAGRVDAELERLKSEGRGFVVVNLSDCPTVSDRGGLPTGPDKQKQPLDASFVTDDAGLRCLSTEIAAHAAELDPSHVFDLTQLCR